MSHVPVERNHRVGELLQLGQEVLVDHGLVGHLLLPGCAAQTGPSGARIGRNRQSVFGWSLSLRGVGPLRHLSTGCGLE